MTLLTNASGSKQHMHGHKVLQYIPHPTSTKFRRQEYLQPVVMLEGDIQRFFSFELNLEQSKYQVQHASFFSAI